MLKKLTTIFLLLLCSLPFLFITSFHIQQKKIQHSMKEELEKKILHNVIIPENNIQWIKKGKEILLHGKMFDIKTIHLENGKYCISGLYDEEETLLVKQLEKNQESNDLPGKELLIQFIQLFQSSSSNSVNPQPLSSLISNNYKIDQDWKLAKGCVSIFTPPPQQDYSF